MKKLSVYCIILLLISCASNIKFTGAQKSLKIDFSNIPTTISMDTVMRGQFHLFENLGGNEFLFTINTFEKDKDVNSIFTATYDSEEGRIIWYHSIYDTTYKNINVFAAKCDTLNRLTYLYLSFSKKLINDTNRKIVLYCIDDKGNIKWDYPTVSEFIVSMNILPNSNLLVSGAKENTHFYKILDNNGEVLEEKNFDLPSIIIDNEARMPIINSLHLLENQDFIVTSCFC